MNTAVVMVPSLFENNINDWPAGLNPVEQKATLDKLLADGYRIKIMNDFVYRDIVFTHYMLEKEH